MLALIAHIAQQHCRQTTQLHPQVQELQHALTKVMRGFGRRCRGQGRVFVTLVRQTEQQFLTLGEPIKTFGLKAKEHLAQMRTLHEAQRTRLTCALTTAMGHHDYIRKQSTQLTHGKKLSHCKLVNAYDLTIAPIIKGKSNCPAQFGRKPGLASEPATGSIFANLVPPGNPSDSHYVVPLMDQVQGPIAGSESATQPQIHSSARDLRLNDAVLGAALRPRGALGVAIARRC